MKKVIHILILIQLISLDLVGQSNQLDDFEKKLRSGDKNALFEITPFFDSDEIIVELLGYHILETKESNIAKRIVNENCIFLDSEIIIDDSTSAEDFQKFLTEKFDIIKWDTLTDAYLIIPLEERKINIEFRALTKNKKEELKNEFTNLVQESWVKTKNISELIDSNDPKSLLIIASELFKTRDRFDTYHFNKDEYVNLIQCLTSMEIGVEDKNKKTTWHIDKAFYPDASLNLLIYFAQNYKDFKWNEQKQYFENSKIKIKPRSKEGALFHLLKNENDSIALDAFIQLTRCNPSKVIQLANEYQQVRMEKNWSIPIFPYRFLKQLVLLTEYCDKNNVRYYERNNIKSIIQKLDEKLSFSERRKLENKIIADLALDEITSFEYWSLIYEQSWGVTYSAGRILDIFYSKHWDEILNNPKQLKLFLKKSYLYNELGIIGICNKYLTKFTNNGVKATEKLKAIHTEERDIKHQIAKALSLCLIPIKEPIDSSKVNDANWDFHISNLESKLDSINLIEDLEEKENQIVDLLSKINYDQINVALQFVEDIPFKYKWHKYSFMKEDWGFFIDNNFDSTLTRRKFITLYNKLSEFELYSYYLDKAGIDYKNADNTLNYNKICEILKYNVVIAFAGGGGGKQDNEVYAVIKILELTHNTTLGYPKKLCNSRGIYGCNSQNRANEWIHYLNTKGLVNISNDEPVSFKYE